MPTASPALPRLLRLLRPLLGQKPTRSPPAARSVVATPVRHLRTSAWDTCQPTPWGHVCGGGDGALFGVAVSGVALMVSRPLRPRSLHPANWQPCRSTCGSALLVHCPQYTERRAVAQSREATWRQLNTGERTARHRKCAPLNALNISILQVYQQRRQGRVQRLTNTNNFRNVFSFFL